MEVKISKKWSGKILWWSDIWSKTWMGSFKSEDTFANSSYQIFVKNEENKSKKLRGNLFRLWLEFEEKQDICYSNHKKKIKYWIIFS